jgi:hypothetical protein
MLDSPKDERSEKDQKHKKQLEEMNNDLLALLRSMDHLGVKLFMLKTEENPSSEGSGSSRFENQQEDQYDDQVDEGVRVKQFLSFGEINGFLQNVVPSSGRKDGCLLFVNPS